MELFAAELAAEKIIQIGPLTVSNSMILGLLGSAAIVAMLMAAAKRSYLKPKNTFASLIEMGVEYIVNLTDSIMHDRQKALKFAPFILTVFFFILFSNWIGLLPGVGPITYNGHSLLRGFTADLNGTLAMAIFTMILIQVYALREIGFLQHLKHYFSDKPWNPINLFVGLLEVLGEFTKALSLALRLFGNVFAGEVLLVTIAGITGYLASVATLPFYFLEIFVGFIQAFVFTMLTIVFLAMATAHSHSEEDHQVNEEHSPEPAKPIAGTGE